MNNGDDGRDKIRDEFDRLLESAHKAQAMTDFSREAELLGWNEHPLPPGFSVKIMARIHEESEKKAADWRILGPVLGLLTVFGLAISVAAGQLAGPSGAADCSQAVSAVFWLATGFGLSLGVASMTAMVIGRRLSVSKGGL